MTGKAPRRRVAVPGRRERTTRPRQGEVIVTRKRPSQVGETVFDVDTARC